MHGLGCESMLCSTNKAARMPEFLDLAHMLVSQQAVLSVSYGS